MNKIRNLLVAVFSLFISQYVIADKLPYEAFAYKVIAEGYKNGDTIKLREGARRCGGAMILANHLGWVKDAGVSGSEPMLSYRGISSASIYHWFVSTPNEGTKPEAIQNERDKEVLEYRGYGQNYLSWLRKSESIDQEALKKSMDDMEGLTPMEKLSARHPFSIEVSKCYEIGLELHQEFSK